MQTTWSSSTCCLHADLLPSDENECKWWGCLSIRFYNCVLLLLSCCACVLIKERIDERSPHPFQCCCPATAGAGCRPSLTEFLSRHPRTVIPIHDLHDSGIRLSLLGTLIHTQQKNERKSEIEVYFVPFVREMICKSNSRFPSPFSDVCSSLIWMHGSV